MNARLLQTADYRRMRWKNGGGWTTELASAATAGAGSAFDWRISIADVESDGPFSAFPGCDRLIALLDGAGMEIEFDEAPTIRLDQRLKFFAFEGEWAARGRLLAGTVRDFNVIVRRAAYAAETLHRPLVGPMVFLPDAATTWFVHVVAGQARLKSDNNVDIATGESLLLEPDQRNRVISGGGELILVKLTHAPVEPAA